MMANCPNCGAPITHLTDRDICEYCGTTFSFQNCRDLPSTRFNDYCVSTYRVPHVCSVPYYLGDYMRERLSNVPYYLGDHMRER